MELTQKMDNVLATIQEFLERMKTKSRDSDKQDFRNSVNVQRSTKVSAETKKGYWITQEMAVSIKTAYDDDESNNMVSIEELEAMANEPMERFERHTNAKYGLGHTPVKKG